ncbi:MAG: glycyl-radical enzyme activating protein [Defluviitaleaceae bacterium]|nr:glycyl-radical enzyme activating protein [Defluviitaleaceae bacterium]
MTAGIKLPVTEIQRFSTQDGPGIRTTVFLKGCPLRCLWCHNPETLSKQPEILYIEQNCMHCGVCVNVCNNKAHFFNKDGIHVYNAKHCKSCLMCAGVCPATAIKAVGIQMTVDEIMDVIGKDEKFYGTSGGVTISGGEPLLYLNGCLDILRRVKGLGYSAAIDTSGYFDTDNADNDCLNELIELTDLFLWDYKITNNEKHRDYTGVGNERILHNLHLFNKKNAVIALRCILIKNINTNPEHYRGIASVYHSLNRCAGIYLIPYHPYGSSKSKQLGQPDNANPDWVPHDRDISDAKNALLALHCPENVLL